MSGIWNAYSLPWPDRIYSEASWFMRSSAPLSILPSLTLPGWNPLSLDSGKVLIRSHGMSAIPLLGGVSIDYWRSCSVLIEGLAVPVDAVSVVPFTLVARTSNGSISAFMVRPIKEPRRRVKMTPVDWTRWLQPDAENLESDYLDTTFELEEVYTTFEAVAYMWIPVTVPPQKVQGAYRAHRAWRTYLPFGSGTELALYPVVYQTPWKPGWNSALSYNPGQGSRGGFYGLKDLSEVYSQVRHENLFGLVAGTFLAKGRMRKGSLGVRASYAKVESLCLTPPFANNLDYESLVLRLADMYDVPALTYEQTEALQTGFIDYEETP